LAVLAAAQEDVRYRLSIRSTGASVAGDAWYLSIIEEILKSYLLRTQLREQRAVLIAEPVMQIQDLA
jgi:hypothetical protein